jgi:hypothetical protein
MPGERQAKGSESWQVPLRFHKRSDDEREFSSVQSNTGQAIRRRGGIENAQSNFAGVADYQIDVTIPDDDRVEAFHGVTS